MDLKFLSRGNELDSSYYDDRIKIDKNIDFENLKHDHINFKSQIDWIELRIRDNYFQFEK